ncbi:MAG: MerR family transcriptional regulator [Myxococcota bacterium]
MTKTPTNTPTKTTKPMRIADDAPEVRRRVSGRVAPGTSSDASSDARPGLVTDEAVRHFKTSEVVALLGLSRRQLQYWSKTGLVEPSCRTPGGHHRYDFSDLVALKATKRLIDAGVSVQKIRSSVGALRALLPQVGRPLSELVLVATGDVVLVFHDETVFEAVTGQEWVFPVAAFEREVSDFRLRQEATARIRQEATARIRQKATARVRQKATARVRHDGDAGERAAGAAGPSKPGVRSAKQERGRWSRTG